MGDSDYSGSPFDSADDDDGSSDTQAPGLDEYTTEDVDESDEDSSGAAAGAAAGAAGAASGAGSGAGAGGAGAAGAGAGGAGIGSASGGDSSNGDTADGENPDGNDGPEKHNEDGDNENVVPQEPEPPERPDNEQEEGDNLDSDHDDSDEDESDKPDNRNDRKQSEEDGNEEREEKTDDDEKEEEDDDDDDDDDEEEETEGTITQYADPWDNVAFGLYPVYYQLQEEYGDQLEIEYDLVPVREFDDPVEMAQKWEQDARKHRMPVNTDVWADDPPSSTVVANRAIKAVQEVDSESLGEYLRRLRVAAIVEGRNIEDKAMLLELAENVGINTDEIEDSWDSVHVRTSSTEIATPKTEVEVEGVTFTQTGIVHVNDLKMPLERAGLKPESLPDIEEFVDKYGPVTVGEIGQVTGLEGRESMLKELESNERLAPVEYGQETFWTTVQ